MPQNIFYFLGGVFSISSFPSLPSLPLPPSFPSPSLFPHFPRLDDLLLQHNKLLDGIDNALGDVSGRGGGGVCVRREKGEGRGVRVNGRHHRCGGGGGSEHKIRVFGQTKTDKLVICQNKGMYGQSCCCAIIRAQPLEMN